MTFWTGAIVACGLALSGCAGTHDTATKDHTLKLIARPILDDSWSFSAEAAD
jgi:hypothetical protein